jgi:hypothetical protein
LCSTVGRTGSVDGYSTWLSGGPSHRISTIVSAAHGTAHSHATAARSSDGVA